MPDPQPTRPTLLPGMAGIAIYVLFVAMIAAFGALNGKYPGANYVILPVSTAVIVGVFGFLRLKRWGWALVTGGCLSVCLWIIYMSHLQHAPAILIMAGLDFVFFLYLIRTEVRDRLQ